MSTAAPTAKLQPLGILRESFAIYRVHWRMLLLAALIVFAPLAVVDGVLEGLDPERTWEELVVGLAQSLVHVFGDVFYAGLVAAAVIAWRAGGPPLGPLQVARTLPWITIAELDIVLPLATVIGLTALVVPGILVFVYLGLAPAFVKIEHLGVRASLRRSVQAVRGSFWRVLAVYVLLIATAGVAEQLLQTFAEEFLASVAVNLLIELLGSPFYGLATVLMAFELGARRPARGGSLHRTDGGE